MREAQESPRGWQIAPPKRAGEQAYERLRRAILDGEVQPGERLTETGTAALLGVSRTPVREAFARLAKDGLLQVGRGGGMAVADPGRELLELYFIREAVEGCAARLAAMRASEDEARAITAAAAASRRPAPGAVEERARLNRDFHLLIAAAGRAPRVERLVSEYRDLFSSARTLRRYTPAETRALQRDHGRIAEAIARRDPDAAEAAMREHLRRAYAAVLKSAAPVEGSRSQGGRHRAPARRG
jgi:DNA-binding GntR family transcriptional regulator